MKTYLSVLLLAICGVGAYVPKIHPKNSPKPRVELQKNVAGAFAAFTIATSAATLAPPAAQADTVTFLPSSSMVIAEKVIREGVYREYEIDVQPQQFDDARSTFKSAQETKNKKGKYTALLAVLIVGSFVIPMAQYFWYVRDDDSSDKFFAQNVPPPPEEPKKKKGWF